METYSTDSGMELLLDRCRAGDAGAWDSLVRRFGPFVERSCRRTGLPASQCADVKQETFVALFQNIGAVRSAAALPKWLAVTATRLAVRHRSRLRPVTSLEDLGDAAPAVAPKAFEQAEQGEVTEALTLALDSLSPEAGSLLRMLFVDQLAYTDIASRTGRPLGWIGPTRQRSLTKLRHAVKAAQLI